jgi:hypothetical protein
MMSTVSEERTASSIAASKQVNWAAAMQLLYSTLSYKQRGIATS